MFHSRSALIAVILIAVCFAIAYGVAQGDSEKSDAVQGDCIHRQTVRLGHGISPAGQNWSVAAGVSNNGGCGSWLVRVRFLPAGTIRGSWSVARGVPAGGHIPADTKISGLDEAEGPERAFSALVGERVRSVTLVLSAGERMV